MDAGTSRETPPDEGENCIECFQNYTAPEVFVQGLAGMINQQDVELIIRSQKQMLQRFEKTNEMLTNCNAVSAARLKTVGNEVKAATHTLVEMKKDLDYIYKKIRHIKQRLAAEHPDAFKLAQDAQITVSDLSQTESAASNPSTSKTE